jgi:1-deoxy-D-xylulose-5-phosphate reductoisomerase
MVEFVDGSIKAQLGTPDMRLPILYALTGGARHRADFVHTDLCRVGCLEFHEPDRRRFPCLDLAYRALNLGGTAPAVLSAADEEAVALFLDEKITFDKIPELISSVMNEYTIENPPCYMQGGIKGGSAKTSPPVSGGELRGGINDILQADQWARTQIRQASGAGSM